MHLLSALNTHSVELCGTWSAIIIIIYLQGHTRKSRYIIEQEEIVFRVF